MEQFTGKVWVLGDDIDTDIIIPTEYLALKTIDDMKQYGFSPLRPELAGQIQNGDIIVAGKNFGLQERTLMQIFFYCLPFKKQLLKERKPLSKNRPSAAWFFLKGVLLLLSLIYFQTSFHTPVFHPV